MVDMNFCLVITLLKPYYFHFSKKRYEKTTLQLFQLPETLVSMDLVLLHI